MEGSIRLSLYRNRRQGTIEGGRKACFGASQFIEGRFQFTTKIRPHEFAEPGGGVDPIAGAEETEPFCAHGHMRFFIIVDDVENRRCFVVSGFDHFFQKRRRHIKATRFENERHDCKPRFEIVSGLMRRLPKAIMRRHVTIVGTQ
ncbi:rieske domain protein [Brucella suis]|nr:rieske domain protein [Brucella suis]